MQDVGAGVFATLWCDMAGAHWTRWLGYRDRTSFEVIFHWIFSILRSVQFIFSNNRYFFFYVERRGVQLWLFGNGEVASTLVDHISVSVSGLHKKKILNHNKVFVKHLTNFFSRFIQIRMQRIHSFAFAFQGKNSSCDKSHEFSR